MRIQNNIMALNTHRQYTINNDNVAKSAEKLSSGYKINRAGDDAAGLAISEKMRSQIRGLNMAAKNSQDAISLVQTAEGALQETHSMLQRMNELANQSATGTNQELDRNALAKEFDQLKREINDVAEQTTFNNMKILDGSLSYAGPQRSAATVGIVASTTTEQVEGAAVTSRVTTPGVAHAAATVAEFSFDLNGINVSTGADTNTFAIDITVDGTKVTLESAAVDGGAGPKTAAAVAAKFDTKTVTIGTVTYTASVEGSKITLKGAAASAGATSFEEAVIGDIKKGDSGSGTDATFTKADPTSQEVAIVNGKAEVIAKQGVETAKVDNAKITVGDTIKIGDRKYEIVKDAADVKAGNTAIVWKGDGTDDLGALLEDATAPTGLTIANTADGFTVTQAVAGTGDTKVTYTQANGANTTTTVEFDLVKLKAGDTVKLTIGDTEYSYVYQVGDTVSDIQEGLIDADGNSPIADIAAKGNAIIVKDTTVVADFESTAIDPQSYNAIRIQVGALEGEQLAVSIDAMNTKYLKLDDQNLNTQDSAGAAVTATRNAINLVSDQRAALGAMQNRLDHKIANLKVSSENLTAAESRIRDVDIASEMTAFTKSNILAQAATAMLAQANSLPQNVLSLLR